MQTSNVLPLGSPVIYFNQWTDFETEEFKGQFKNLTAEEIKNLKVGQEIYIDVDPLHRNGKVYGRVKAVVSKIEPTEDEKEFRIYYKGGAWSGFKTTRNGINHDVGIAINEQALFEIVSRLPLSKVIYPYC